MLRILPNVLTGSRYLLKLTAPPRQPHHTAARQTVLRSLVAAVLVAVALVLNTARVNQNEASAKRPELGIGAAELGIGAAPFRRLPFADSWRIDSGFRKSISPYGFRTTPSLSRLGPTAQRACTDQRQTTWTDREAQFTSLADAKEKIEAWRVD